MKPVLRRTTIFSLLLLLLISVTAHVFALANPAAVFCEDQGYEHQIKTDAEGNQYGVCLFDDGQSCGSWDFYNNECGSEYRKEETTNSEDSPQAEIGETELVGASLQATPEATQAPPSYQDQIEDLRETYKGQLENYRNKEKAFTIAKDQYKELQTLASIEKAVQSSKDVLSARNKVLTTYLEILRLSLLDQTGIPEDEKQFVLNRLVAVKDELEIYDQVVQVSADRDQINLVIADFEPLGTSIKQTSDHALLIISLGKLQSVYDQGAAFFSQIESEAVQDGQTIQQKEVERAITETNKILDEESAHLANLWQQIKDQKDKNPKYDNLATTLKSDFNSSYSNLNKLLSYIEELIEL